MTTNGTVCATDRTIISLFGVQSYILVTMLTSLANLNRLCISHYCQAICTSDLKFIDCYAGEVGSIHDASVFKRSPLYSRMMTDSTLFTGDTHIVGDAAYPPMKNLILQFKDNGSLSACQRRFNTALSSARCVIERAFALLKGQ